MDMCVCVCVCVDTHMDFPGGSVGKESACSAGDNRYSGLNPQVGEIPWRRAWQPTLYSCLENPIDRGAWQATVQRVTESWTQLKRLRMHICPYIHTHTGM